ncbi:MAG: helix-turn-helix domain-containing protein [bacterium]|nr:helix-turn-helix domain-containing protein [bacterium]
MTEINEKSLEACGLTPEQGKIYLFLLQNGMAPAKGISLKTGIGRPLTYKILERLIELGLVEKRENVGKVTFFSPRHPKRLKELADKRKEEAEHSTSDLQSALGLLMSQFNALQDKPNIQFYEGVEGIKKVYGDILETGEDILVVSSPIHEGRQDVLHLIKEQVQKQAAQNIKTRAITPHHDAKITALPIGEDEKHLITRKQVPAEKLNIPAQVIVYGDNVAITNFKESLITVAVESKYIAETFRLMFEYMWEKS